MVIVENLAGLMFLHQVVKDIKIKWTKKDQKKISIYIPAVDIWYTYKTKKIKVKIRYSVFIAEAIKFLIVL